MTTEKKPRRMYHPPGWQPAPSKDTRRHFSTSLDTWKLMKKLSRFTGENQQDVIAIALKQMVENMSDEDKIIFHALPET